MANSSKVSLVLYHNTKKATVCELHVGNDLVLATTHPATILAALQAMELGQNTVLTTLNGKQYQLSLAPISPDAIYNLWQALDDSEDELEHKFLDGLLTFKSLDFFNPPAGDSQADIHLRTAIHHLPVNLVKRKPAGPPPADWPKQLKHRNQFIYHPEC